MSRWLLALFLAVGGCAGPARLERRARGHHYMGRAVPADAYAYYARGLAAEKRGNGSAAEAAYANACRLDPASGSAWAARGRVACRTQPARAEDLFAQGLREAEELVPLLVARAECRLAVGSREGALRDAREALARGPELPEVSRLLERALLANGKAAEARIVHLTHDLLAAARGHGAPNGDLPADLAAVDAAIGRGDLQQARQLSRGLLSPGQLSLRLLALGRTELALEQAQRLLAADPDQADALLAEWLASEHLARQRLASESQLLAPSLLAELDGRPSTLGILLFAAYLQASAGDEASRLFLDKMGPLTPADALERALLREVAQPEPPQGGGRLQL